MATQVKNLKLNDKVYKEGDALNHSLAFGSKTYNGSADQTITAEDLGVGNAYIPKGSISVSGANTGDSAATPATTWEEGWVYNMSDGGTIVNGLNGQFTVLAGDNIVRVKDANDKYRWDKLAATITVPEYKGTAPITVTDGTGADEGKKVIGLSVGDGLSVGQDGLSVITAAGLEIVGGNVQVDVDSAGGLGFNGWSLRVNAGDGLEVDNSNNLKVKAKTSGGVSVSSDGVAVTPGNGITVGSGGVAVKPNASGAISVDGNGVAANVDATKGLKIDNTSTPGKIAVNNGNGLTFNSTSGALEVLPDNNSVSVGASGVAVKIDSSGGLKSGTNGVGVKLPTNSGLSTSADGLAVGSGNGIQVSGTAVAVKPSSSSGKMSVDADTSGVYVSLDRAGNVGSGSGQIANLDNKTIGEIVAMLGGTVSNS